MIEKKPLITDRFTQKRNLVMKLINAIIFALFALSITACSGNDSDDTEINLTLHLCYNEAVDNSNIWFTHHIEAGRDYREWNNEFSRLGELFKTWMQQDSGSIGTPPEPINNCQESYPLEVSVIFLPDGQSPPGECPHDDFEQDSGCTYTNALPYCLIRTNTGQEDAAILGHLLWHCIVEDFHD